METIQIVTLYAGAVVACCLAVSGAVAALFFSVYGCWRMLRTATKDFRSVLKFRDQYVQFCELFVRRRKIMFGDHKKGAIALQFCQKCEQIKACKFRCYKSDSSGMVVDFVKCDCEVK